MHPYTVYGIETSCKNFYNCFYKIFYCMHLYTVYGIETPSKMNVTHAELTLIACTLIPFTVLKLWKHRTIFVHKTHCMHPYTVYGIETPKNNFIYTVINKQIACTLIPFTVLKQDHLLELGYLPFILHAPLYRLRY